MKLIITGSPGTGKTTISKKLAKKLKCRVLNEHDFALEKGIGKFDHDASELVVPLPKLRSAVSELLKKEKDIVLEGHLLCEVKLQVDAVVVLRVHPEILESRLEARGYNAVKTQDNVFCEGIDYCTKHAVRKYGGRKVIEVRNEKGIKETLSIILKDLTELRVIE